MNPAAAIAAAHATTPTAALVDGRIAAPLALDKRGE
jgi:hypothetical protein